MWFQTIRTPLSSFQQMNRLIGNVRKEMEIFMEHASYNQFQANLGLFGAKSKEI